MCICLRLNPTSVRFFPFELRGIDRIILSQRGKRASSTGSESYRRWQERRGRSGEEAGRREERRRRRCRQVVVQWPRRRRRGAVDRNLPLNDSSSPSGHYEMKAIAIGFVKLDSPFTMLRKWNAQSFAPLMTSDVTVFWSSPVFTSTPIPILSVCRFPRT